MVNRIKFSLEISLLTCIARERDWAYKSVCPQCKTTPESESINILIIENLMLKQQGAQTEKQKLADIQQPIDRTAEAPEFCPSPVLQGLVLALEFMIWVLEQNLV